MFVVAVGLGPFAGVMALFIHNTGIIAKLFSEAVESADPRPVEGIRATHPTLGIGVRFSVFDFVPFHTGADGTGEPDLAELWLPA